MLEENKVADEPVTRILGSFIVDNDRANSPTIFVPGGSVNAVSDEGKSTCFIEGVDFATAVTQCILILKTEMTIREIMATRSLIEDESVINDTVDTNRSFFLRWKRIPSPGSTWSEQVAKPIEIAGYLEAIFPYLIVTGRNVVAEFGREVSDEHLTENVLGSKV